MAEHKTTVGTPWVEQDRLTLCRKVMGRKRADGSTISDLPDDDEEVSL